MLPAHISRRFPFSSRSFHSLTGLCILAIIVISPNARVLPDEWTGSLYNEKRIWEVFLLCAYGVALLCSYSARTAWQTTFKALPVKSQLSLATIGGLGLLSAVAATRPDAALLEVTHFILLSVLTIGVATWTRENRTVAAWTLVCGFTAMALAYGAQFMAGMLALLSEDSLFSIHHLFLGFSNLRFFNHVQTWTLPLLAILTLWLPKRFPLLRFLAFLALITWWLLLYLSASRGASLAICGGGALTFLVFRRQSIPWVRVQILSAVAALTIYYAFYHFFLLTNASVLGQALPQRLEKVFEDSARISLLRQAWQLFSGDPLLGAGPMHFAYYYNEISLHPHNVLMQLLAEWGLPATFLIGLLSLWGLSTWTKEARDSTTQNDRDTPFLRVALFASFSGAALHSLVCGIVVMPLSQLLAVCVIGLMLGDHFERQGVNFKSNNSANRNFDRVMSAGLGIAALLLGSLSTLTFLQSREILIQTPKYWATDTHSLPNPRFWLPGDLKVNDDSLPPRR